MSNDLITRSPSALVKSYWSKPDGKVSGVILAAGGIAGAYGIIQYNIIGKLLNLAWFGVEGLIAGSCLLAGGFILTNKRVHYLFQLGVFHFTDIFITHIDPKTILKKHARDQAENLKAMNESRSLVDGSVQYLEKKIKDRQKVYNASEKQFKAAGGDPRFQSAKEDAADEMLVTGDEIRDDQENLDFLLTIREKLDETYDLAERTLKKIQRRYNKLIRDRETMRNVRVGVMAGQEILKGGKNAQDVIDAEDRMVAEIAHDVGYFKQFIRETQGLSDAAALQKKIAMQSAMEKLTAFEQENSQTLISFKKERSDEELKVSSQGAKDIDLVSIIRSR